MTRKITRRGEISLGLEEELSLGDLEARRDWGYAPDNVSAMWLMLQSEEPDDYVVATGEAHSVQDLVEGAFAHVGLDWRSTCGPTHTQARQGRAPQPDRRRLEGAPAALLGSRP